MATFPKSDLKFQSGEDLVSTYVFTQTVSGKPKDKTFCKACGVPLWTVTESARQKGQVFVRTALLGEREYVFFISFSLFLSSFFPLPSILPIT